MANQKEVSEILKAVIRIKKHKINLIYLKACWIVKIIKKKIALLPTEIFPMNKMAFKFWSWDREKPLLHYSFPKFNRFSLTNKK